MPYQKGYTVYLSILYLRCWAKTPPVTTAIWLSTFQFSIWDAQELVRIATARRYLSILYLRCRGLRRRAGWTSLQAFNSLFEMPMPLTFPFSALDKQTFFQFSIWDAKRISPVEYVTQLASLSILYLRCSSLSAPGRGQGGDSFNSLFEMLWTPPCAVSSARALYPFNSLFEMPV